MVVKLTRFRRLALLAFVAGALLAMPAPAWAGVEVGIVAPTSITPGQAFTFGARVPGSTEAVSFYVDGRHAATRRSPAWRMPKSDALKLRKGRHVLTVRARRNGKIYRARRAIVVAGGTGSKQTASTNRTQASGSTAGTESAAGTVSAGSKGGKESMPKEAAKTPEAHKVAEATKAAEAPEAPEATTTTETTAPETPSNSSSFPLFDGSRVGAYSLLQEAPGAITEVPDPAGSGETVFRMNVNDSDVAPITPTENPRAQALAPANIENGDEFWLQTKFMLPENLPSVPGWMSLVAIYGAPFAGSGPWGVGISGNEFSWQRNETYGWDVPWHAPVIKGKWVTVTLHELFAEDGFVEMWINGEPITFFPPGSHNPRHEPQTRKLLMATMDSSNDGGANAAKIMQYREVGMFQNASVYFGALKLGPTRASVES